MSIEQMSIDQMETLSESADHAQELPRAMCDLEIRRFKLAPRMEQREYPKSRLVRVCAGLLFIAQNHIVDGKAHDAERLAELSMLRYNNDGAFAANVDCMVYTILALV